MDLIVTYQALSHGPVQVQECEVLTNRHGVAVPQAPHAYTLDPGADLSNVPDEVREVCEAWWTPARRAAWESYNAKLAAAIVAERERMEAIDAAVVAAQEHERLKAEREADPKAFAERSDHEA